MLVPLHRKLKCGTKQKYQESKFSATQRILNTTVKMKLTNKFPMQKETRTGDNLHKNDTHTHTYIYI